MDILKHRNYEGTAELDMSRGVCRGKILFVDDLITYEASTPKELQREFERAVDDYIETCRALKRAPKKPLKGAFNVRVPPEMHKAAILRGLSDNVALNEIVVRALHAFLFARVEVHHNVQVTVAREELQTVFASGSDQPKWEKVRHATH
jgi:predicted HicB family RNase H-like nuclease